MYVRNWGFCIVIINWQLIGWSHFNTGMPFTPLWRLMWVIRMLKMWLSLAKVVINVPLYIYVDIVHFSYCFPSISLYQWSLLIQWIAVWKVYFHHCFDTVLRLVCNSKVLSRSLFGDPSQKNGPVKQPEFRVSQAIDWLIHLFSQSFIHSLIYSVASEIKNCNKTKCIVFCYWIVCYMQTKPLVKLQTESDSVTGQRVLTCYLLPQQTHTIAGNQIVLWQTRQT